MNLPVTLHEIPVATRILTEWCMEQTDLTGFRVDLRPGHMRPNLVFCVTLAGEKTAWSSAVIQDADKWHDPEVTAARMCLETIREPLRKIRGRIEYARQRGINPANLPG